MPEVPKITPNSSSPAPERKDSSSPDRFEEHMRKNKVSETDPEEQKKRKRSHEAEEEKKAEETKSKDSKIKKQETQDTFSFLVKPSSAPSAKLNSGNVSSVKEVSTPIADNSISTPQHKEEVQAPSASENTKKSSSEKPKEKELHSYPTVPLEEASLKSSIPSKPSSQDHGHSIAPTSSAPIPHPVKEEHPTASPEPIQASSAASSAHKKKENISFATPFSPTPSFPSSTPPIPVTKTYANFPAHVLDLFERMVGVITVLNTSGIKETTIHLSGPQFASSPFEGCKITIQEFSSAPKAFNIQFTGNPEAVKAFEAKIPLINTAFTTGGYDFKVNRLEASLGKIEGPVLHRKQDLSEQSRDQDQQGKR